MNRFIKYGVGGIFFLLPLFFLLPPLANTIDAQLIKSKFLLCFFLGNIAVALLIYLRGQLFLAICHALITVSVSHSLLGVNQIYPYVYWLSALGIALFFITLEEEVQVFCFKAVIYGAVASSVLGIFQALDMDPILSYAPNITEEGRRLPVGMLAQTTKHGAFLAIAFGMALGLRQWFAAVIILTVVLLTKSSFSYLSVICASLVWIRYAYGRPMVRGLIVFGGAVFFYLWLTESSLLISHGRFDVWQRTIDAWWNGPVFWGYGLGSFAAAVGPEKTFFAHYFQPEYLRILGDFLQAHNDYLQLVFEMGIIGIVIIGFGLFFVGKHYLVEWWGISEQRSIVVASQCGLTAILVNAIGNFPFQLAPHFFLAVIFLALLLDKSSRGYNKL